ncbi:MAG: phosphoenolpyruvate carboxylase [Patescibacteria group bacterium]
MIQVPKCMSTQHPDNVHQPFFVENSLIGGEDEIQEAFYAFSHLGCDEQMWDFEGKEVDNFVVKKLLTKNEPFFRQKKLGRDVFLTYRVPNPDVERGEAKILLETLENIPRSYDAARLFYGEDITPIFEVILPMATNAKAINRIYHYYKDFVAGKQDKKLSDDGMTIGEWIGDFKPQAVNVIPLFEDKTHMLAGAAILKEYLSDKKVEYQRVFLARSDPAVNYGHLGAVLLVKIAAQRLYKLKEELGIPIYPILGAGSAPFRGNLRPQNVDNIIKGYPSIHTFTIQSSFKFDNPPEMVQSAIKKLRESRDLTPVPVDEERALTLLEKYSAEYIRQVKKLAPVINEMAAQVPKRRKRKLHIGLFGYSRSMDEVTLPRAITFTAAMYSLGAPPELLGLNALSDDDISFVKSIYPSVEKDLSDAYMFANPESPFLPPEVLSAVKRILPDAAVESGHRCLTDEIISSIKAMDRRDLSNAVAQAADLRGFLG